MFILMLITLLSLAVFCLGYLVWMDDQIENPPVMPETELEKRARSIKYRLKDLTDSIEHDTRFYVSSCYGNR